MKTTGILVTGLILIMNTINTSSAATKCVALNSSSTCTGSPTAGRPYWNLNCNNIPITGVALCSSTSESTVGQTAAIISTSSTSGANKYCWCKMISPAISYYYVFAQGYPSTDSCLNACASACTSYSTKFSDFRNGFFKTMTN